MSENFIDPDKYYNFKDSSYYTCPVSRNAKDTQLTENILPYTILQEKTNYAAAQDNFMPTFHFNKSYQNENSVHYINGFLMMQIGKKVKAEFLIGNNTTVEKTGYLLGIGVNYLLLNEEGTNNLISCDLNDLKFVTVYTD